MSKPNSIAFGKLRNKFLRMPVVHCPYRLTLLLLSYCDRDTYESWPSQSTLQRESTFGRSAVNRALRTIEELGLFHCETIGGREMRQRFPKLKPTSKHSFTIYTLNPNAAAWKDAELINRTYARHCEHAQCQASTVSE